MRVTYDRKTLLKAVSQLQRHAVSARSTLPVLAYLQIGEDGSVSATDLDTSVWLHPDPAVKGRRATVCVRASQLRKLLALLTDETVTLDLTTKAVKLAGENFTARLDTFDAADYPEIPCDIPDGGSMSMDLFRATFGRVFQFTSKEGSRPILNGIYYRGEAGIVTTCATNGHVLGESKVGTDEPVLGTVERSGGKVKERIVDHIVVPPAWVQAVLDVMKGEEMVTVGMGDGRITARASGSTVVSRLIEGKYPGYGQVFEQRAKNTTRAVVNVNRMALIGAAKRTQVFASDYQRCIMVVTPGSVVLHSFLPDYWTSYAERIETTMYAPTSERYEIAVSTAYLIRMLSMMPGEEVALDMAAPENAIICRSPSDPTFTGLVMPLRILDDYARNDGTVQALKGDVDELLANGVVEP